MYEDLPKSRKDALNEKSKYYFTGKPCKHGHISPKLTSCFGCIECGKIRDHHAHNLQRYGITPDIFAEMVKKQNYKCVICGFKFLKMNYEAGGKRDCFVDHCHTTGKIRGILCSDCNFAIGLLKDDASIAANVAAYLVA